MKSALTFSWDEICVSKSPTRNLFRFLKDSGVPGRFVGYGPNGNSMSHLAAGLLPKFPVARDRQGMKPARLDRLGRGSA